MKSRFVLIAGMLAMLSGCTDAVVYQSDVQVPDGSWDRSFTPKFEFEITDTVQEHDVYIDVRHTGQYAFSDLFLFVDLEGPEGRAMRDTVDCLLADPTGRWYGRGLGFIFADRFEAKVLYKLRNRFPATGRYSIKLEQAMRTEKLEGIQDIGISIERAKTGG